LHPASNEALAEIMFVSICGFMITEGVVVVIVNASIGSLLHVPQLLSQLDVL